MNHLWILVLAMGLVTFIPRMLPMTFLGGIELPRYLKSFFQYIPYTALGALIFPDVLFSTGHTASSAAGALIAAVLAFFRLNLVLVVIGGILGVFLAETLIYS